MIKDQCVWLRYFAYPLVWINHKIIIIDRSTNRVGYLVFVKKRIESVFEYSHGVFDSSTY